MDTLMYEDCLLEKANHSLEVAKSLERKYKQDGGTKMTGKKEEIKEEAKEETPEAKEEVTEKETEAEGPGTEEETGTEAEEETKTE